MIHCITPDGSYYDGAGPVAAGSVHCAARPSASHVLATDWQTNPTDPAVCWRLKTQAEIDAENVVELDGELDAKKILRLVFEIDYDQENRLRAQEGKAQITRAQYRDALIAKYKTL